MWAHVLLLQKPAWWCIMSPFYVESIDVICGQLKSENEQVTKDVLTGVMYKFSCLPASRIALPIFDGARPCESIVDDVLILPFLPSHQSNVCRLSLKKAKLKLMRILPPASQQLRLPWPVCSTNSTCRWYDFCALKESVSDLMFMNLFSALKTSFYDFYKLCWNWQTHRASPTQ